MELKISYKDGSTRIVSVHPEFFKDAEVRDRFKTTIVTPEQKAKEIALAGGAYPYEILLTEGTEVVFKEVNKINKPETIKDKPVQEWVGFMKTDCISEKEVKALKKERFTKSWNPRTSYVPADKTMSSWERGLRLFLNK